MTLSRVSQDGAELLACPGDRRCRAVAWLLRDYQLGQKGGFLRPASGKSDRVAAAGIGAVVSEIVVDRKVIGGAWLWHPVSSDPALSVPTHRILDVIRAKRPFGTVSDQHDADTVAEEIRRNAPSKKAVTACGAIGVEYRRAQLNCTRFNAVWCSAASVRVNCDNENNQRSA